MNEREDEWDERGEGGEWMPDGWAGRKVDIEHRHEKYGELPTLVGFRDSDIPEDGVPLPNWWIMESGRFNSIGVQTISHMDEVGVTQALCLVIGFPYVTDGTEDEDPAPGTYFKSITLDNDTQITGLIAALVAGLNAYGGQWTKRAAILDHWVKAWIHEVTGGEARGEEQDGG